MSCCKRIFFTFFLLLTIWTPKISVGQINRLQVYYLSHELILEKKYKSAIDVLNVLLRGDSLSSDGFFLRGIAKYNLGDIVGAEHDFSKAIDINPVYTQAYQYRAITRGMVGNYADAIADFETALDIRPDMEGIYFSRGVTYFLSQQFEKAIDDFNIFLRRKPHTVDGYINRGTSYLMLKDTTSAIADYNRAIETNIYNPTGYYRRGAVYLAQDSIDRAYLDITKSIELDSTLIAARFTRAIIFEKMYRPMDAIAEFGYVLSKDSTSALTYFNRAILRSQIGDYNNAMDDYDKVAELTPRNVLLYFNRGTLNNMLGNLDEAEEDFSTAIELYPDFANAYLNRSNVRHRKNNMKGAESDYKIAQSKIEEYRTKMNEQSFALYADTSKHFSSLLSFDPDFGNKEFENVASKGIEVKLMSMQRYQAAKEVDVFDVKQPYVNMAIEKQNSELKEYHLQLTSSSNSLSKEQVQELKEDVLELLEEEPNSSKLYFILASLEESLQRYSSSVEYYTKAIELEPSNPFYYMNRGVARAQMTSFISSLSNSSQKLIIDGDPVKQLNQTKRVFSYKDALDDLNRAILLDGDVAHFYYNRAAILHLESEHVKAIDDYTKAISLYPYFSEAYYNRGMIQLYIKESRKGLLDMSTAGEMGVEEAYEVLKAQEKLMK